MLALLLVAVSVGLGNFAAAVSLGTGGVDARVRLRVGLIFGAFEAGMPVIGLLVGDHVAGQFGQATQWVGGALLATVGLYGMVTSRRASAAGPGDARPGQRGVRLLLSGLALSLDNLVAGFAIGTAQVSIVAGALVIGGVSAALSLAGLELGAWLGARAGHRSAQLGNLILIAVGAAVAFGLVE
jgi:manganese efflux pump family protein